MLSRRVRASYYVSDARKPQFDRRRVAGVVCGCRFLRRPQPHGRTPWTFGQLCLGVVWGVGGRVSRSSVPSVAQARNPRFSEVGRLGGRTASARLQGRFRDLPFPKPPESHPTRFSTTLDHRRGTFSIPCCYGPDARRAGGRAALGLWQISPATESSSRGNLTCRPQFSRWCLENLPAQTQTDAPYRRQKRLREPLSVAGRKVSGQPLPQALFDEVACKLHRYGST